MLEEYAEFCYNQIGTYILDYLELFENLRPQLDKAGINVSLPEYVSMAFFSALMGLVISITVLTSVFVLTSGIAGFFYGMASSLLVSAGILIGFYLYPSILIQNRASKIKDMLPFATLYMSTLAGTGTEIQDVFKVLGEQKEYGEVSKEAKKINRDIEAFGNDISEALKKAADRTPSQDFKELMWGMNHVITSGGSLRDFLQGRSNKLMNDYQRRVEEFADQLGLLVEMYITLVIVGSIIFTSMSAVMSSFTGYSGQVIVLIQIMSIFIGLPLISAMFILLVKGIAPGGVR